MSDSSLPWLDVQEPTHRLAPEEIVRREAFHILKDLDNIFILELYRLESFVLQVKVTKHHNTAYCANTTPWSIELGRCVTEQEFRASLQRPELVKKLRPLLNKRDVDFEMADLVRFILQNTGNKMTTLVSTAFADQLGRRFMHHMVCKYVVPGRQDCAYECCSRLATAAVVDGAEEKRLVQIFCSEHVYVAEPDVTKIMLYNPLAMDLSIQHGQVVVSAKAMWDAIVLHTPEWSPFATLATPDDPIISDVLWTEIVRIPISATTAKGNSFLHTVKDFLDCYKDHFRGGKHHTGGWVCLRHSLTVCCLRKLTGSELD